MIGVGFMIWGLNFVVFVEHTMLNVFRRLWGLRRTPLVASGVLRSTLDPLGSLSMKTPPLGGIFRQNAPRDRRCIRASLALIERHLQVVFYHRTPPEGGALLDRSPVSPSLTPVCAVCVPSSPLTGREPI